MYTSKKTSLDIKQKNKRTNVKPKCAECLTNRTFLDKINDKYELEQLAKHFFFLLMYFIKENEDLLHEE